MSQIVVKSPNDRRDYKSIQLSNQIVCLLISDKEAEKSAASLDVNIGSVYDPEERNGLAHFLEHMLFMGTEKYPVQNEYSAYLSANSGADNAFTMINDTNYYFDCSNSAFYGALDRFAQFFVHPLFDTSCVEREVKAVDSEFQMSYMQDMRRKYQLFRSSALPGHPYNKFQTGNKDTLDHPNIRDHLLTFYYKYYSANLMRLVVYGKEDLETLENWVKEFFSDVKDISAERLRLVEQPYTKENMRQLWKMYPNDDKDTLEFVWVFGNYDMHYKNHPIKYVSHLIGHEGPNSLLSYLIDEGLALSLVSGYGTELQLFTKFTVNIQLTKKGLENYKEVCRVVFQYLKMLKGKEPDQKIFEEMKKMDKISFNFKDKEKPIDYVKTLSRLMQYYPVEDVLQLNYLMEEFKPDLIKEVINAFTSDNMRIYLISKSLEKECDLQEKYYNTKYSFGPLPQEFFDLFENPSLGLSKSGKKLDLPPANVFIPENFEILAKDHNSLPQYPQKVYTSEAMETWFKQDNIFKVPKAYMETKIYSNDFKFGLEHKTYQLTKLWIKIFKEFFRETLYLAEEASLEVEVNTDSHGIEVTIKGYNDSLNKMATELFTKIKEFDPVPFKEIFENILVKTIRDSKNFFKQPPYNQSATFRNALIRKGGINYHPDDEVRVNEELTFEDLLEFHKKFFRNMRFETFFIGNLTQENAITISQAVERIIMSIKENSLPLAKEHIAEVRTVDIPQQTRWYYEYLIKPSESGDKEKNSLVTSTFQYVKETPYLRMLLTVLKNYLQDPCFDTLRTNEQLGYIVSSGDFNVRGVLHYAILVQSSKHGPQYLGQRVLAFLDSMKEKVQAITEEEFQKYVESVRVKISQKDLSVVEEGEKYWFQIITHMYEFNKKEVDLEELKNLKREDFVSLFMELFYKKKKLIEVHLVSPYHVEENNKLKSEITQKGEKITHISSNEWFKRVVPLYPDLHNQVNA